jgi:hypothetical protein
VVCEVPAAWGTTAQKQKQMQIMKKSNWQFIVGLALCALLPVMTATAKDVVQRPFKAHGQSVIRLDLSQLDLNTLEAPWSIVDEIAVGTHTGRWNSSGSGTYSVVTGAMVGSGFITLASGDLIWWSSANNEITMTGGTGRFANVSGSFVEDMTITSEMEEGPYVIITVEFTASGTIAY